MDDKDAIIDPPEHIGVVLTLLSDNPDEEFVKSYGEQLEKTLDDPFDYDRLVSRGIGQQQEDQAKSGPIVSIGMFT